MSIYFVKGKGWRFDFTVKGERHTQTWFKTKSAARQAEQKRREELSKEVPEAMGSLPEAVRTDTTFLDLVERRLDYVKAFNSEKHYHDNRYLAKAWIARWGDMKCDEVSAADIERFVLERSQVSPFTANKEIRHLRALFNFGKARQLVPNNPTDGMRFLPTEKRLKHLPSTEDICKVINAAEPEEQDYLWTLRETLARCSEVNRLTWADVDLENRYVVLYTRKKRGGHLTPRRVPMTERLHAVLSRRFEQADPEKPWVFWHKYWDRNGQTHQGPYGDRKKMMKRLCKQAKVKYFRFHPLRHAGASLMENHNVPISAIQKILGHENRRTTEIYLHSVGDSERAAMAIFERVSGKSHTESHTASNEGSEEILVTR